MRLLKLCCWLSLAIVLSSSGPAMAQAPATKEKLVLRTHEVGDLVVGVPDYVAASQSDPAGGRGVPAIGGGGGMGAGGGGFGGGARGGVATGASESNLSSVTLDDVIAMITKTVASSSWAENGGGEAQLARIGTTLVVLQTPDAQSQIEGLLTTLRNGSAGRRSVTVDARWLLLDSNDLDRLVSEDDKGVQTIDRKLLAEFTRRPSSVRALTQCFSGQRVYLMSGTRRTIVSGYIPVVGSVELPGDDAQWAATTSRPRIVFAQYGEGGGAAGGRSVGYQPIVEKPNFGVLLDIRPTLMEGAKAAVVDLTSTVTFGGDDAGAGEQAAPPMVDRVAIDQQELATTLRVTLGEPTLVGGMSYVGDPAKITAAEKGEASAGGAPAANETPQLYLVLEIR